jgi:hypothetical protein
VATQVTSPSASNFGVSAVPSSSAALVPGDAKGILSDNEAPRFAGVSPQPRRRAPA